jgi:hypothetical protein
VRHRALHTMAIRDGYVLYLFIDKVETVENTQNGRSEANMSHFVAFCVI